MLTLAEARKSGRLAEFIAQEEERGVAPVPGSAFDRALKLLIKQPRSEDRTSRSASRGGSRGK
jgi:hypothetical protein